MSIWSGRSVGGGYPARYRSGVGSSYNAAERELRSVARGRKAWLFVGSDRGGQRAAMMFSLFGTARLIDVDPLALFTDALARIADIPQSHLHELLPWHWKAAQQQLTQEIAA